MRSDAEHKAQFRTWWQEHRGVFHRLARAYAADPADESDLLQEMAVQLWKSLPGFRGQCKPVTWVYRVCLNTALGWRRGTRARGRVLHFDSAATVQAHSDEPRPGWTHEKRELLDRLYGGIRLLRGDERTVILLSLDGLSYREISEITGLTENHVGVSLSRARKTLTEFLQEVRNEL